MNAVSDFFHPILGTAWAAAALSGLFFTAYTFSLKLLGSHTTASVRLAGTIVLSGWILTITAETLGLLRLFNLYAVSGVFAAYIAAARAAQPKDLRSCFLRDVQKLKALSATVYKHPWVAAALLLGSVPIAVRLLRGLAMPPLAWDSLTYHFVKSADWVNHGGPFTAQAPDAWSYYDYYPRGGEVLWAWAMLPTHSDVLLPIAGFLVWTCCACCAYAAARAVTKRRIAAVLTAAAVVLAPSVGCYLNSGYVDNTGLVYSTATCCFLLHYGRTSDLRLLCIACIGTALAAAVKSNFLLALFIMFAFTVVEFLRRGRARYAICALPAVSAAVVLALLGFRHAVTDHHALFYPVHLEIAGVTLSRGNDILTSLIRGEFSPDIPTGFLQWCKNIYRLFRPRFHGLMSDNLNLGPGMVLFIVAGLAAGPRLRGKVSSASLAILFLISFVPIAGIFTPEMKGLRHGWWEQIGRLLISGVAGIVVLGADYIGWKRQRGLPPLTYPLVAIILAANAVHLIPVGWGQLCGRQPSSCPAQSPSF
jgi:hypothetical protein